MKIADSKSPLFQESLVYKPFHYSAFFDLYKAHEKIHWVTEEVELSDDVADWRLNLSDDEKSLVKTNLTIFTTGDIVVAQNYKNMLIPIFKNNEVNNFLTSVAAREAIHQEAYALANETFGLPDSLFGAFQEFAEMRNRVDLMSTQYDTSTIEGVSMALAHTTFNEGVGLFGAFISLLHLHRSDVKSHKGKQGMMKGLTKINKWSLRDESLHVDGSSLLHRQVLNEHRHCLNDGLKKKIYDLARKFTEVEDLYIDLLFANYKLTTISKEEVKLYIRYMIDRRLIQLGYKGIYGVKVNPCPWVDDMLGGAGGKKVGNFFEVRVDDYMAGGATTGVVDWDIILGMVPISLHS